MFGIGSGELIILIIIAIIFIGPKEVARVVKKVRYFLTRVKEFSSELDLNELGDDVKIHESSIVERPKHLTPDPNRIYSRYDYDNTGNTVQQLAAQKLYHRRDISNMEETQIENTIYDMSNGSINIQQRYQKR